MMQDLAMHILELLMNSIKAKASLIKIKLFIFDIDKLITVIVEDDGLGMSEDTLKKVIDPFTTSRLTRKIGLGVSFFKGLSDLCNGTFNISSKVNIGTTVKVTLEKDHLDLPPLGDLGEMLMLAIQADENIDYEFEYKHNDFNFNFNTRQIKDELNGISICEPDILIWIKEYIDQQISLDKED